MTKRKKKPIQTVKAAGKKFQTVGEALAKDIS